MKKLAAVPVLILIFLALSIGSYAQTNTNGTLEYFYSSACESCEQQKPIMEKWLKDNEAKLSGIVVEKINVEAESVKALARGYKNQGIPYFQARNIYGEVIANGQGVQSEKQLTAMVELMENASEGIEFVPDKKTYKKNGKEIELPPVK